MRDINLLLEHLTAWTVTQKAIIAVLLVGSYAPGTARDDSDVDQPMLDERMNNDHNT